jgi:BRO family, N-terminal domain
MSALSPVGQLLAQMRSAEREENPGVFRGDKKKGEPWFVAGDVCEVLGIENVSHALSRIKSVNIVSSDVENSRGQLRKTRIVNESGLYRLIFQSRKPEAEKFTDWVTGEVLPQIRKPAGTAKTFRLGFRVISRNGARLFLMLTFCTFFDSRARGHRKTATSNTRLG